MRSWVVLMFSVAALAGAGCGDDDDGGDAPDTPATQPATTGQPETTEPEGGAPEGGATSRKDLESCLADAKLELKPGSEPFTDEKGQKRTRQPLSDAKSEYAGYVQWPSDRISDVYVAADAAAAQRVEDEAAGFIKAFGLDPATYVRRTGTVVLTFDDPPPSDDEVAQIEACAGGD